MSRLTEEGERHGDEDEVGSGSMTSGKGLDASIDLQENRWNAQRIS
jgi:hypothetical protein